MELFGLILCFCSGTYGVYVTQVNSRTEIPTSCNLAAPSLSTHDNGVNLSLDSTFALQGSTPSGIWVDYISDYVYLQIVGCISTSDISRPETIRHVSKPLQDPFYCVSDCNDTKYIGLMIKNGVTTCLCLTISLTSINTTRSTCNIACGSNELMCGSHGSAAVFKQVSELDLISKLASFPDLSQNVRGRCLSNRSGTVEWTSCETQLYPACMSISMNGTYGIIRSSPLSWLNATAHCFKHQHTAVQFGDSAPRKNVTGAGWWIGVIRGQTIFTAQKARTNPEFDTLPTRQYGFVTKDVNVFYLDFTSNTTWFQWALCNGSILDTNQSTRSIGMYVGISVAVVVLIVSVTGGCCCWRRRNSSQMKDNVNENQSPSGSTAMTNKAYSCENETFAYIKAGNTGRAKLHKTPPDIAEATSDPHYFVLERKSDSESSSIRSSTVKPNDSVHYNCIEEPEHYSRAIENEFEDVTDNYHTIPHSASKSQPISLGDNYDRIHPITNCETSNSYGTGMYSNSPNGNNLGNTKPITGQCDDYDRLCLKEGPNSTNYYDKLGRNRNALDTSTYSTPVVKTTVHSDYDSINQVKSYGIDNTYDHIGRHKVELNKDNSHTDNETSRDNNGTGYDTLSTVPNSFHNECCGPYSHVSSG